MIKRLVAILAVLSLSASVATAAYHITPDTLRGVTPQVGEAGDVITVDFSGTEFWDLEGSIPPNMTGSVALGGPGTIMNGIGWDTISTSFGASWGSEMTIGFSNDADLSTKELFLTVSATGAPVAGEANSSGGILKLLDAGIPNLVLADGSVYWEAFESFDDVAGAVDGVWDPTSTLSFQVPEPATMGLLVMAGLSGLVLRRRS